MALLLTAGAKALAEESKLLLFSLFMQATEVMSAH